MRLSRLLGEIPLLITSSSNQNFIFDELKFINKDNSDKTNFTRSLSESMKIYLPQLDI